MNEWDNNWQELRPLKGDFDPVNGCLDALNAWKNFGGLSRTAAYEKFCEHPDYYQEDFAFMGGSAFAYYYPIIERYILESSVEKCGGNDVEAMCILAYCIKVQCAPTNYNLRARVLGLIRQVRNHLAQYSLDSDEQGRIDMAWDELERSLRDGIIAG